MNLELVESFGQNYPEDFDGTLDSVSIAVTCAFNRRGSLLAVGCNDGRLVIWDFLTRGIARIVTAHVHPVCSLSWNRDGKKLLSASTDNTVSIWDVLTGDCDKSFRFPSPILKVMYNPRDSDKFLVCPMKHPAVKIQSDSTMIVPLDDDSDLNIVASFDRRGGHIVTGNARGKISVFDTDTLEVKASFRIMTGTSNTTAVKSIEFARRGECFLVNSADRIIRVYNLREVLMCGKNSEVDPIQKLQDLVNKTLWKKCTFSGDGEYICAGSARQHALYIWEQNVGNLVKILHGTKGELLLDLVWHPVRPIIASISSGVVSIWAQNQVENWSAFAPDFKELDENIEYEERESEFDVEDEDKELEETKSEKVEDDNVDVDVTTCQPIMQFLSSDEEEEDEGALLFLPVTPDIDDDEYASHLGKDPSPTNTGSKKKRVKCEDIDLPDAPIDEIHPLLNVKKPNEKATNRLKPPRAKVPKMSQSSKRPKEKSSSKENYP